MLMEYKKEKKKKGQVSRLEAFFLFKLTGLATKF